MRILRAVHTCPEIGEGVHEDGTGVRLEVIEVYVEARNRAPDAGHLVLVIRPLVLQIVIAGVSRGPSSGGIIRGGGPLVIDSLVVANGVCRGSCRGGAVRAVRGCDIVAARKERRGVGCAKGARGVGGNAGHKIGLMVWSEDRQRDQNLR